MRRKALNCEKLPPSYRKLRFLSDSSRMRSASKTAKPMLIVLVDIAAEQIQALELNNEAARAFHELRFIMEKQLGLPMFAQPLNNLLIAQRKPQRRPAPVIPRWLRPGQTYQLQS